jgi:hypothetical protein
MKKAVRHVAYRLYAVMSRKSVSSASSPVAPPASTASPTQSATRTGRVRCGSTSRWKIASAREANVGVPSRGRSASQHGAVGGQRVQRCMQRRRPPHLGRCLGRHTGSGLVLVVEEFAPVVVVTLWDFGLLVLVLGCGGLALALRLDAELGHPPFIQLGRFCRERVEPLKEREKVCGGDGRRGRLDDRTAIDVSISSHMQCTYTDAASRRKNHRTSSCTVSHVSANASRTSDTSSRSDTTLRFFAGASSAEPVRCDGGQSTSADTIFRK